MRFFNLQEEQNDKPAFQMAPLIDIVFNTLVLFMALSVFYQLEYSLSIKVPKAVESEESLRSPGEIVINVQEDGTIIVNDRKIDTDELKKMLIKISALFPNQPIIIRADKKTYHENVIAVLDACAAANIWNISFSTIKEEKG